jgi:hypothetical protein
VLIATDGSEVSAVAVSQERNTGLFNPHTLQGDIIVNIVKTSSSYTAVVAPTLARSLLWPVRMQYSLGYDIDNGAFKEGSEILAAIHPQVQSLLSASQPRRRPSFVSLRLLCETRSTTKAHMCPQMSAMLACHANKNEVA